MNVRILTAKLPDDFQLEANKWASQHVQVKLEVRQTREFHDRFIALDDGVCFHVGCSLKDAGTKAFMISRVEDDANRAALIHVMDRAWGIAKTVLTLP